MKSPISAWGGDKDPRPKLLKNSREYLSKLELSTVQPGFGEGLPDVSTFPGHLEESRDLPLPTFLELWEKGRKEKYVEKLSFNPLEAKYFDLFMDSTKRPAPSRGRNADDFALSEGQLSVFKRNGFVVGASETHWGRAYYRIYNNDLPVLITADSILHAFHKSYDTMLKDLEVKCCVPSLMKIFNGMRTALKESAPAFAGGPLEQSLKDMDFYLTVGINLLNAEEYYHPGDANDPALKKEEPDAKRQYYFYYQREEKLKQQITTTLGGSDGPVDAALKACKTEQKLTTVLFGKERTVDFSLFKPRGHYTKSASLRQYFRAFTWLAKIDLILAGEGSNIQQTGSAVILYMLLTKDKEIEETYHTFNKIIEALVGPANSMEPKQLGVLLDHVFKLKNYESLNSEEALTKLQAKILETESGKKLYNNKDCNSFTFIGQKFSIDSWAQSKVVTNDDEPNPNANVILWEGQKIHRHSTSAVEVAFSVLANDDAVPVIHQRISDASGANKFRDGLSYHPYLLAARKTVDALPKEAWSTSIYTYWLAALRKLSIPMDERFPEAMRTQAFAMKKMETQLGSWAQARHDNILYIEQLGRMMADCEYPDGFVEPYVEFWEAMEALCMAVAEVWTKVATNDERGARLRNQSTEFFKNFAQCVRALRDISAHELANQPLTTEQTIFLKTIVELQEVGSGGDTQWTGWYPSLFYGGEDDLEDPDLIVADTYTNPPADTPIVDPGCVVHQGLGLPRRMLNNGKDICAYAGPVYGYYEFELPGIQRWNDEQWGEKVGKGDVPAPPEWTASYYVPK